MTGRCFKHCACMHPAHHICLIFCVFLLDTSIYLKAYGEVLWLQLFTSVAWNWWVLKITNLQSWTKSVKNYFCTPSPTECLSRGFGTTMTPPLTPPWSILFIGDQKWSRQTLTLFSCGKGEGFVVTSDFKSFILKQDMANTIFLHIFAQDCSSLTGYARKNPHPHDAGHKIMCSSTKQTHLPSDMMCSPTHETHIPSDMCSSTKQTHFPSDMCYPTWLLTWAN